MLAVGQVVKVLAPFNVDFSGEYSITEVVIHDDGQITYILGDAGGFDIKFLEVI